MICPKKQFWGYQIPLGAQFSVTPSGFILLHVLIRGCAIAYPCLKSFAPLGLLDKIPYPELAYI